MKDQLTKIEEYAAALMQPHEVAILVGLDADKFQHQLKHNPEHEWTRAYNKGRLQTKFELRKKVIALAKAGSPQAEVLADKYLQQNQSL